MTKEQKAGSIYKKMTSYTNPEEMRGIPREWMVQMIAEGLEEWAAAALASYADAAEPTSVSEALKDLSDMMARIGAYETSDHITDRYQEKCNRIRAVLEGQVTGKSAENLIEALKEIVSPIQYMQNRLQEGETLNGVYAHELSRDSSYLKSIAEKALASYASVPALERVTGWIYATDSLPDPFKVVPCKYSPDSPDPRKDTELHWGFVNKEGVWSKGWKHHQVEWLHESGEAGKQPEQKNSYTCTCDPAILKDEEKRFAQQVVMELPEFSQDRQRRISESLSTTVCIDPCIADVIKKLWDQGIETTGCCCGHGEMHGWVGVHPDHYIKMFELGYEQRPVEVVEGVVMGVYTFYL